MTQALNALPGLCLLTLITGLRIWMEPRPGKAALLPSTPLSILQGQCQGCASQGTGSSTKQSLGSPKEWGANSLHDAAPRRPYISAGRPAKCNPDIIKNSIKKKNKKCYRERWAPPAVPQS